MKEKNFYWPLVSIKDVNTTWWDEVIEGTRSVPELSNLELSDEAEFTIRVIYYVLRNKSQAEVEYAFAGSLHIDRVLQINKLLRENNPESTEEGRLELDKFVQEFISDASENSEGE